VAAAGKFENSLAKCGKRRLLRSVQTRGNSSGRAFITSNGWTDGRLKGAGKPRATTTRWRHEVASTKPSGGFAANHGVLGFEIAARSEEKAGPMGAGVCRQSVGREGEVAVRGGEFDGGSRDGEIFVPRSL